MTGEADDVRLTVRERKVLESIEAAIAREDPGLDTLLCVGPPRPQRRVVLQRLVIAGVLLTSGLGLVIGASISGLFTVLVVGVATAVAAAGLAGVALRQSRA